MKIYSEKILISKILYAISEPYENANFYIHKPSGQIELINETMANSQADIDLFRYLKQSGFSLKLDLTLEFADNPKDFCKIPNIFEVGIEKEMRKFIADNPRVGMKKCLTKKMTHDELLDYLSEYIEKFDLTQEWQKIYTKFLIDYAVKWCERNHIDYVNDYSEDYINTMEDVSYIFSVSLRTGCYRHIKISSRATLFDLHESILEAFGFIDDHAHAFFMNNRAWDPSMEYSIPEVSDGCEDSSCAYLADFHFDKGDKFLYIFDFGEEWRFSVKFLRTVDAPCDEPEIIRSVGEAPEQYGYYY